MTYAHIRPAAAPALDRLALAGVLAVALAACCLTGCVNQRAGELAVELQRHIEEIDLASRPIADTPKGVEKYERAIAAAKKSAASLVQATGGGK